MKTLTRRVVSALLILVMLTTLTITAASNNKQIISLGADLNDSQKQSVLSELNYTDDITLIEVTNAEEYIYLGGIIPDNKIGSAALSSARIDFLDDGQGLVVDVSDNINYITEDIYHNALSTAGITDAKVIITAPMSVTGTGALTGIMKAYEVSTGENINEDLKHVATQEMVTTAELSETLNDAEVLELIDQIKLAIETNKPDTREDARNLVINISNQINISLTDNQIEQLTDLVMKMKDIDIDWNLVKDNAIKHGKAVQDFLSSEEGKGLLVTIKNFFVSIIDWIVNFF